MGSENNFALPLDLPSWNEGIKSLFAEPANMPKDLAPVEDSKPSHGKNMGSVRRVLATNQDNSAQTYHQKVIHDPHAMHAQGLANLPTAKDAEFWIRKAEGLAPKDAERVLMEALQRDVQPVTSIARALHELHKAVENSPAPAGLHVAIPSQAIDDSQSLGGGVPSSLTPGRTGLSGKAFRVPSRLANTPGAVKNHGAAAPQTKFHGILKKLQFSAAPTAAPEEKPAIPDAIPAPVPVPAAVNVAPTTTTKRLQFESHSKRQSHETPLGATNFLATSTTTATTAAAMKSSMRKVTFGGSTISPSHKPPRRTSMVIGFQTPSAVAEGGSGDEDENGEEEEEEIDIVGGSNGTVNSRNAGATPFDRRLSALLSKYEDEPAIIDEEAPAEVGLSGGTPNDLWKRLSSISATESIKALALAYERNTEDKTGDVVEEEESKESDGNNSSLESMSLANSTPVVLVEGSPIAAAVEEQQIAVGEQNTTSGGDSIKNSISPNTAVASVLGVLLRRSLEDIEASKAAEAAAELRFLPSRDAVSPTSGVLSMLPAAVAASGTSHRPSSIERASSPVPSLTPMSIDGVLRDDDGIPIATPSSVTLYRGAGAHTSRRNDDGIPADLFRSFSTPPEEMQAMEIQREAPPAVAVADFAFSLPGSARQAGTPLAAATGVTPAAGTPLTAASVTSSEGTPEFKLKNASAAAKTGKHKASPSPLRFGLSPTSLGKAQRVRTPSRSPAPSIIATTAIDSNNATASPEQALPVSEELVPPPSLTKELRGLLQGMSLATPTPAPRAVTLSPARASPMQQRELGVRTVVTPVRRSPRLAAPVSATHGATGSEVGGVSEMLEAAGFVYVPNPALSTENSEKKAAESVNTTSNRTAKKKENNRSPAVETTTTDENGDEVTPVSRYGLRSASKTATKNPRTAATTSKRPGSGDKALKLSPTEQNIRNSLRSSSRQKRSSTTPTGSGKSS